jgi:hypothetical protein
MLRLLHSSQAGIANQVPLQVGVERALTAQPGKSTLRLLTQLMGWLRVEGLKHWAVLFFWAAGLILHNFLRRATRIMVPGMGSLASQFGKKGFPP